MSIFKAYDIRGIYGQDLNEDIFYRIARAYAQFCGFPGKRIDIIAFVKSNGFDVIHIHIAHIDGIVKIVLA